MILKFIKIALTRIRNDHVKLKKNFASFPEVGHDGAKDFAAYSGVSMRLEASNPE